MSTIAATAAALLATVRATPGGGYTADNTSTDDFRVLDAEGYTFAAVILRHKPSTFSDVGRNGRGTHGKRVHTHFFRVLLAAKRSSSEGGDGVVVESLEAQADAVIAQLESYTLLGGGVTGLKRAEVVAAGDPRTTERGAHYTMPVDVDVVLEVAWNPAEPPR